MGQSGQGRILEGLMGANPRGVLYGLEAALPASGLTLTYTDGIARVGGTNTAGEAGQGYNEVDRQGGTQLVTASMDGYLYLSSAGVVTLTEVALGAAKPTQADIGEASEFLWKTVSDGSDITAVTDLRKAAGIDLDVKHVEVSFETDSVGEPEIVPGFAGRLLALDGFVINALSDTDAGTVVPTIVPVNGVEVAVTGGSLSFALSAAIGVRDLETVTALGHFGPFDRIRLTGAKTTVGGLIMVNVALQRL